MKTKDTSYGEYAIIKEPDVPVLYSMSENCRGVKRRVHFEEDAGIMKGFFTKIKHGKRIGYFGVDEIEKIVDHKDAKSNITKEAMFAANGMMPMEPLRRMHFLLLPEKKDVQDLRKKEHAEPQFVHCDYYPDDKERFLDDLSFFAGELSDKELFHIKKYLDDIFQDKAIVKMLYKYRKNHEKLLNLCKDMEKEVDMSILHEQKELIAGYKEMILSLIWEEFPASEDKQVEVIPVAEETPVFQESDEFEFSRFPSGIASLKKK